MSQDEEESPDFSFRDVMFAHQDGERREERKFGWDRVTDHEKHFPPRFLKYANGKRRATRCEECKGRGMLYPDGMPDGMNLGSVCHACKSIGYFGICTTVPTICLPGTLGRIAVLAARCRARLPLGMPLTEPGDVGDEENRDAA